MPKDFSVSIPRLNGDDLRISLDLGESVVFVGANGAGKTRLGVFIENKILPKNVQRIAAQKSLSLNDNFNVISSERAQKILRFGVDHVTPEVYKANSRWGGKPAIHFLSDFDALLQALFAEHNQAASRYLRESKVGENISIPTTQLEKLKSIWDSLLPHRVLQIDDASVRVRPNLRDSAFYNGSEMSDGERAIFYFLGQSLLAPHEGVVIVDEPEAHIHKAILSSLWDTIEKARPDCSFLYITHDFDFAATHSASQKFFLRSYVHSSSKWDIGAIPEDTGLPEQVVVELLGSRKPMLFVEGELGSIDLTIYRSLYTSFTIVPMGSCDQVIHSVKSYDVSSTLHWLDVRGLVDADHRTTSDIAYLAERKISVLPVAEAENILLLPRVFLALARALACIEPNALLEELTTKVVEQVTANADRVSARHTVRQLDRRLKKVEVTAKDLLTLNAEYNNQLATIAPANIFTSFKDELIAEAQARNLPRLLEMYENKGVLSIAASLLGIKDQRRLIEKVGRLLGNSQGDELKNELISALPNFAATTLPST